MQTNKDILTFKKKTMHKINSCTSSIFLSFNSFIGCMNYYFMMLKPVKTNPAIATTAIIQ